MMSHVNIEGRDMIRTPPTYLAVKQFFSAKGWAGLSSTVKTLLLYPCLCVAGWRVFKTPALILLAAKYLNLWSPELPSGKVVRSLLATLTVSSGPPHQVQSSMSLMNHPFPGAFIHTEIIPVLTHD